MEKLKPNSIKTDRLVLHEINFYDKKNILEIFSSEEVSKTYMLPKFNSYDEMNKLFMKFIDLSKELSRFVYGIYLNDELIGFVNDVEIKEDFIELGYVINPKFKSNGYMTEALTSCIQTLHTIGFKTVRCGAFSTNIASIRVMKKAAMKKIAFTEEIAYNGKIHNCLYFEKVCE